MTLGPRDRLIGQLHIDGDVRLGGTVEGEIHATGDVEVDDEAKVNASLAGGDVNIRGHVSGPVTARKRLVVARSGSLTGDVRVARLVIQDGASFSGKVSMGPQSAATPQEAAVKPPEPAAEPIVANETKTPEIQAARSGDGRGTAAAGKSKPPAGKAKPKR
ncbi:MAG: polymer-forming cytoskeletal protein [Candidatus Dormibacteraeota bacterium]|nr:polymer-forming cytoskeletal protein [Candidatus Dormibacteraeota bacterium]